VIDTPHRVQLRRSKGWMMPPNTLKVDRTSRWGNPWRIVAPNKHRKVWAVDGPRVYQECADEWEALSLALRKFRFRAETTPGFLHGLRGKNLACWCALDKPCHADVLLELANTDAMMEARK